jgi:hypothetical protein
MQGLLDRTGWHAIPSTMQNPTNGVGGVVSNLYWGTLQPSQSPGKTGSGLSTAYPSVGSTAFNTDLASMEQQTGNGGFSTLLTDMNGVENGNGNTAKRLKAGSQVKIRAFCGLSTPNWMNTLCGQYSVSDGTGQANVFMYTKTLYTSGAYVTYTSGLGAGSGSTPGSYFVSSVNGEQYKCISTYTTNSGSQDPANDSTHWVLQLANNNNFGMVCRWFGNQYANGVSGALASDGGYGAAPYLSSYAYWQQLMAATRVWIDMPNYTTPGQSGSDTATWYVGSRSSLGTHNNATTASGPWNDTNSTAFTLDTCPLIGEIPFSACCTIYAEFPIRQIGGGNFKGNVVTANALALGYTSGGYTSGGNTYFALPNDSTTSHRPSAISDVGMLFACMTALADAWSNTSLSAAFSLPQNYYTVGAGGASSGITESNGQPGALGLLGTWLIAQCNPGQAVPGTNDLNGSTGQTANVKNFKGPYYFQTQTQSVMTNAGYTLNQTIANGIVAGARNIEMPSGSMYANVSGGLAALATNLSSAIAGGTGAYKPSNTRSSSSTGPVFTSDSPATTATVGTVYALSTDSPQFVASGTGVTYSVTVGTVPDGLTFSSSGLLYGTPSTAESSSFTVTATDSSSNTTDAPSVTIVVAAAGGTTAPNITVPSIPDPVQGVAYSGPTFTADQSPITWLAFNPTNPPAGTTAGLPPGMTVDSSSGALSGTPTTNGAYTTSIKATNSAGTSTVIHYVAITVDTATAAPAFTADSPPSVLTFQQYQYTFVAPGCGITVGPEGLPNWLTFDGTDTISGNPVFSNVSTTPPTFTMVATNSAGVVSTPELTIQVINPTDFVQVKVGGSLRWVYLQTA